MAIATDEALLGGVTPQFLVDVSAEGTTYRNGEARSSIDELIAALRAAATYKSSLTWIFAGLAVAAFVALAIHPWLLLLVGVAAIGVVAQANASAARRKRVAVVYHFDTAAARAYDSLANGVGWLASSRALWRSDDSSGRTAALAGRGAPYLLTNIGVPSITSGGETLLFFPEVLVVRDHASNFVDVPYSFIRVECETTRFRETQTRPPDSRQVAITWLHTNKDGSPDRRRSHNPSIPVLEYARVELTWRRTGCVLLVSNVAAARHFANALNAFARPEAPKPAAPVQVPARPLSQPAPPPIIAPAAGPRPVPPQPAPVPAPAPAPAPLPNPRTPEIPMSIPTPQRVPAPLTEIERVLQASLDRRRRLDELEQRASNVMARADARRRAQAEKKVQPNADWIAPGGSTTVYGHATGDLVYVGTRLPALNGDDVEPSLINPTLPIDRQHANNSGGGIDYWPSYSEISAASRTAYLQWLAGGRKDPHVFVGYVFIFFYGLERRVYELVKGGGTNGGEALAIAREVSRLLALHARRSQSFAGYGDSLLDLIASIEPRAHTIPRHEPIRPGFGVPMRLKIALGELSVAGKPIPASIALAWIHATHFLNTPATRCPDEFELLFHIRYAKQFGDGMIVKPNKTFVDLAYRPASSALDPLTIKRRDLPDITQRERPIGKLIELARECTGALDSFSRFLGKNADARESLAAFALLPDELVEATPSADAKALASLIGSRLDADGRARLTAGELLPYVRLAKLDKVSKNEAMLLAQALERIGYGIEPDVRLGGPVFESNEPVVAFRRLPDCPSVASEEYAAATLLIRLGVMVSAADDVVSQAERELLERHIEQRLQLTPGERQRLSAHLAWLIEADLGMTGLKKRLESLPQPSRHTIARLLVDIAATDGHVEPREMKILEKLYALLDLPSSDLYRDVHSAHADDEEPIVVDQPALPPKGFAIPAKPVPAATTPAGLDMSRVRLKIAETREVSALLSSIFVEEVTAPATPVVETAPQADTIGTLDAAHSELLRRLAQRESWPREEVEQLAAELALLPDGALETINDYAYATLDAPFWEDDDPLAINSNAARELTR